MGWFHGVVSPNFELDEQYETKQHSANIRVAVKCFPPKKIVEKCTLRYYKRLVEIKRVAKTRPGNTNRQAEVYTCFSDAIAILHFKRYTASCGSAWNKRFMCSPSQCLNLLLL